MGESRRRTVINKYALGLDSDSGTLNRKAVLVGVKEDS
jgi:hypothetical protein